jgi:uncharacterized protein YjlB
MYAREALKKTFERITGVGSPSLRSACGGVRRRRAQTFLFKDDGTIPNNPRLPLICYRNAVRLGDAADPAAVFEELFEQNGWQDTRRDGIYDYMHYHSRAHEVLGIARGRARVRFGGDGGKTLSLKAEDVVVLPAGTGHQCLWSSQDFLVVGAYPLESIYDECGRSAEEHARAIQAIPNVRLPAKDPIYGADRSLLDLWLE